MKMGYFSSSLLSPIVLPSFAAGHIGSVRVSILADGRLYRTQILGKPASFSAQGLQRFDARGSSRRNVRSNQCDSAEQQTYARENRRVRRRRAK
jgi:hypothetical protein